LDKGKIASLGARGRGTTVKWAVGQMATEKDSCGPAKKGDAGDMGNDQKNTGCKSELTRRNRKGEEGTRVTQPAD